METKADMTARPATPADAPAIREIYNQGIEDRIATFETAPRSTDDVEAWFDGRHPIVSVIDAEGLPHQGTLVSAGVATVLLSVFAHGMSSVPLTNRYVAWFTRQATAPPVESVEVHEHRWRGQLGVEHARVVR